MTSAHELERLVAEAVGGSDTAFAGLWHLLAPPVLGYLTAQGSAEPEDLCSDVFVGVFRSIGRFSGDAVAFRSWVFSIAHHRLIDERRRRERRPPVVPVDPTTETLGGPALRTAGDIEAEAGQRLGTARVIEICRRLVPDQRDVLLLRLVCDLTVEQIAEVLDRSPGAVKALQRRAIAAAGREISGEGVPL